MSIGPAKALLLFAALGFLLYSNALKNPFHYDDLHSIRYNPHIRSLDNVPRFFTDLHTFSSERSGTMFRPLLLCSYALNYALHGEDVVGYRIVNLVLHIVCAWLVWSLVCSGGGGAAMALLAGGLFLLHPLAAEPVNYISSRSDMLMAVCVVAAVRFFGRAEGRRLWGMLALFVAGLLVKSVAVVFPALCLLSLRGEWKEEWRSYIGRFAAMGSLVLIYLALIVSNRFLPSSLAKAPRAFDANIWTQIKAYVYSVWLYIMPVHLNVDHPFVAAESFWDPHVLWPFIFLLSLLIFFARMYRSWLGMGGLWFFVAMLPYALIPLNIMVSERRTYLAGMGFALLSAFVGIRFFERRRRRAIAVGVVAVAAFFSIIAQRNSVWASDIRLWEEAVRGPQAQHRARVNLALAYNRAERWDDAREQLRYALQVDGRFADAWVELGNIEHRFGALAAAETAYLKALESQPSLAGGHYNLGNIYMAKGERAKAVQSYAKALQLNPNFAMAHNNIGQAYEALAREDEALAHYRSALDIDPDLPQAWFNLAVILERRGQIKEAGRAYMQAYELLQRAVDYAQNTQFQQYAQRSIENAKRLGMGQ